MKCLFQYNSANSPKVFSQYRLLTWSLVLKKSKAKYTRRIAEMKATSSRFMDKLQKAVEVFKNLKTFYDSGNWKTKQMILGSTFPEKLIFEKNKYQIPRLNTVLKHKKRTNSQHFEFVLSSEPGRTNVEPF
ncbi:MAG: hypothetical protein AAF934_04380 [Bacteroidota bacterium]